MLFFVVGNRSNICSSLSDEVDSSKFYQSQII